jgi:glycosyltransferase involved in cell wall biosynthesis
LAASAAVRENVDCVIVHTPPFFSITRYLGASPIVYFFDHGEPNPEFFPDRMQRELVNWEKRFCAALAKRIFAVSRTIEEQCLYQSVTVLRNGNSHMAKWSLKWNEPRRVTRAKLGWKDKFVVLNVCRFGADERLYKGVDKFIEVMDELWFSHPNSRGRVVFALAGKANSDDILEMQSQGLAVLPNVSDEFMIELYAASDLYMNFSKWEGYNLGIGQALAMGLPVIASDIEAHREFPVIATNNVRVAIQRLQEHITAAARGETRREAVTFDWDKPIGKLVDMIRIDLKSCEKKFADKTKVGL